MSQHNRFKNMPAPKHLSANLVAEDPEPPSYTHEEWVAYISSDDGWTSYQHGEAVDESALREVLTLVGGGKSKGKGFKGKGGWNGSKGGGWNDNAGKGGGWNDNAGKGKGKGKFGKGYKGGGKGEKGKSGFNGNCHNCGAYGHRAADCSEPKQQQGVRYVSDYYQQPTPMVFMLTTLEDSNVDYRNPWITTGKSNVQLSISSVELDAVHEIHNKFDALTDQDGDPEDETIKSDSSSRDDFPIPVPDNNFPKRTRMPKLPPRVTQSSKKSKSKCCCDGDDMGMRKFDQLVSSLEKCHDKCCQPIFTKKKHQETASRVKSIRSIQCPLNRLSKNKQLVLFQERMT